MREVQSTISKNEPKAHARIAGLWFAARFAHNDFRRLQIFTGFQFAWRAIRLVAVTAMKTTGDGMAAVESSRILRFVASVPP